MTLFIENLEQYSVINFSSGEVESAEAIQVLQDLSSQTENAVSNMILDLKDIHELNGVASSFVKKVADLSLSRNGIFVVAGAHTDLQKELESNGMAENITFLPTVAEGVDAVFFHDLEQQFGMEGGDLGML